tara:strand:+ start:138 stop:545 length:408 start_codon:yes stop_codon:yes gene_type:complete
MILVIHGPNMNLIHFKSKIKNKNVTLSKINRHLKKQANKAGEKLKILETYDEIKAVKYIHKNKNKISGIIIFPGPWQQSAYIIKDLLNILQMSFITISTGEKVNVLKGIENYYNSDILISSTKGIIKMLEIIRTD